MSRHGRFPVHLGDTMSSDGNITWTRVGWDDSVHVPSPGIGWLISGAEGIGLVGGDAEQNQTYQMAFLGGKMTGGVIGAFDSSVDNTWIETSQAAPFTAHGVPHGHDQQHQSEQHGHI